MFTDIHTFTHVAKFHPNSYPIYIQKSLTVYKLRLTTPKLLKIF